MPLPVKTMTTRRRRSSRAATCVLRSARLPWTSSAAYCLERRRQVPGDAHVVDDVAAVLAIGGPVDARDGLQQLRALHGPVQVEHLLDGGVEPGEQHRLHKQERGHGTGRVRGEWQRERLGGGVPFP